MGRTSLAKASIAELKRRIKQAQKDREKVKKYLTSLENKYHSKHISYEDYHAGIRKQIHGKTPSSLIHYYGQYIRACEVHLKHHKKKVSKNEILTIFASLFFVLIIIAGFFLTPSFVGYVTQEPVQGFYEDLNLIFDKPTEYEWQIKNSGTLDYVNIDGLLKGQGDVQIYLDDFLIYDSTLTSQQTQTSLITGQSIFGITGLPLDEGIEKNETINSTTNNSYSEEINLTEEVLTNGTSPSQQEPLPSSGKGNIQEDSQEISLDVLEIIQACEETCDLSGFNLNKNSYVIRVEISDAVFELNTINYGLIQEEIVKESPPEKPIVEGEVAVVSEEVIQGQAVLGQPVVWKKIVQLKEQGKARVNLPSDAQDIVVKKIKENKESNKFSITGGVVSEKGFFNNLFSSITGRATDSGVQDKTKEVFIEDDALEYEIEYTTPAPYAEEEILPRGKKVKIVGSEEVHYENVLSFANLDEELNIKDPSRVRIYWYEDESFVNVEKVEDKNNNGIYDYIEWITPHLSNQTFGIVIVDAEHIFKNRKNVIANIYSEVNESDNVTYTIPKDDYARVYFESNLTNGSVIDVVTKNTNAATINVYEKDSSVLIGSVSNVLTGTYYIELNLAANATDFDMESVSQDVIYDFIHDADRTLTDNDLQANDTSISEGDVITLTSTIEVTGGKSLGGFDFGIRETGVPETLGTTCGSTFQVTGVDVSGCAVCTDDGDGTVSVVDTAAIYTVVFEVEACSGSGTYSPTTLIAYATGCTGPCVLDGPSVGVTITAADNTYPVFTVYEEDPVNASNYSFGQAYQINVSIADNNGTAYLDFDNNNYSASNASSEFFVDLAGLGVGTYSYEWWSYGNGSNENPNVSFTRAYTVNKSNGLVATLTNNKAWSREYDGTDNSIDSSETNSGDGDVTYDLFRNSTSKTAPDTIGAVGVYEYVVNTTGGTNYTANASFDTQILEITQNSSSCGVMFNETSSLDYNSDFLVWSNCTSANTLYLNGSLITNNSDQVLGVGLWNFTTTRTDTQNYSNVYNERLFTIDQIQAFVNLTLDVADANITIDQDQSIWINCSTINGDANADLLTERAGAQINYGTSQTSNFTTFSTIQVENITCVYEPTQNYTINSSTYFVNVTGVSNVPPIITSIYNETMTDVSPGPNEGPSATYVIINFTVNDENGFANLNDSSAKINFTKGAELRENVSCIRYQASGNEANYTCNITMWWWDSSGTWDISATIKDDDQNEVSNISAKTFYLGLTTGFKTDYSSLNFLDISPGSTNLEATNIILMNNTGNDEVSIDINATNLYGEFDPAYALGASNFSSHTDAGCEGTPLVSQAFTPVSGALLQIGNYTLNDSTGQEKLYFCMEQANSDLTAQYYSTDTAGAWTIRIFMVVLASAGGARRKKKKKFVKDDRLMKALNLIMDELKEEYSLNKKEIVQILLEKVGSKYGLGKKEILEVIRSREQINIPLNIFSNKLGALESLVKYMKENLSRGYREIAKELKRDERTIWTAYKKACEKQEQKFEIKENNLQIPLSIFENKELTILESLIIYFKDKKNLKYVEIGELINRDQRNIWTIYSRAKSKLKKRNI